MDFDRLTNLVTSELLNKQATLVDLALRGRPGRYRLVVLADKESGISIDECAEISRQLGSSETLNDLLGEGFELEVSSPGVKRPLKSEADFRSKIGRILEVTLSDDEGKARKKARLISVDKEGISLDLDGKRQFIRYSRILKAVQSLPW